MAGTSTSELIHIVKSLGIDAYFLGVFDKNFPGFLDVHKVSYAIVNTGDYVSGGMHWIAFAYDPNGSLFYMFDPFGWSNKDLYKHYKFQYDRMLKHTALQGNRCIRLLKSVEAVQCLCSAACGLFCCLFLASFYHYRFSPLCNNPIIDIVTGVPHSVLNSPRGIKITHCNQKKLYDWLYVNCLYFRKNAREIKNNTRINAVTAHYTVYCLSFF
ncbi:protease [unidentified adenovirus]|uniref:Protease n=1 Tax=Chinstrap penguin adenovirus 2 TaxID=1434088 RepID=A0A162HSJ7_9ADEN|nr:protease [Chinstrap penguin adenovirus 2]ALB78147.1 protease [Chinstrap penguin adenovirus 2]ALB78169.1 protease [unidentified adenovirus]